MKEEWKDLEFMGYHTYEVSNLGNVRSKSYGLMSDKRINKYGYRRVRLYKDGSKKEFYVHRLVAMAFVVNKNPEEFDIVNHMDENKLNNRADNLEWCDTKYNVTYGTAIARRVETKFKNDSWNCEQLKEINRKPVYKYDLDCNIVKTFISQTHSNDEEGVSSYHLSSDVPIKSGFVYSYRDDLTFEEITTMIDTLKQSYKDMEIKAYQYDFDCNLVAIHKDVNKMKDVSLRSIKDCLEGVKKYYNKCIWSSIEIPYEELKVMVDDIMNYRKILRYDLDNFEIKEYENIDCVESDFSRVSIYGCCNGNGVTHQGYIWSYDYIDENELNNIKDRLIIGNKKKVYQYNLLGEFVKEWDSIEDCIKAGYTKTSLHDCFNGLSYQHNGYIWSKFELSDNDLSLKIEDCIVNTRVRPVYQYSKEYDLVKAWNTTSDASKNGYPTSAVSECCRGIRKSYKGYIWSYRKLNK